jgi:hypothetical protein
MTNIVDTPYHLAWYACGVDRAIISSVDCPESERIRFTAIGALVWASALLSGLAGVLIAFWIIYPDTQIDHVSAAGIFGCSLIGFLWFFLIFNLLRLATAVSGRRVEEIDVRSSDTLRAVGIAALTGILALVVAAPFQIALMYGDTGAQALSLHQQEVVWSVRSLDGVDVGELQSALQAVPLDAEPDLRIRRHCPTLFECQTVLNQSDTSSDAGTDVESALDWNDPLQAASTIVARQTSRRLRRLESGFTAPFFIRVAAAYGESRAESSFICGLVWLMLLLPPAIRLLAPRGAYDFLIIHRNRALLAEHLIDPAHSLSVTASGDEVHTARYFEAEKLLEESTERIRRQYGDAAR